MLAAGEWEGGGWIVGSTGRSAKDFTPTFLDDDPRITQALFPRAHADVGGRGKRSVRRSPIQQAPPLWEPLISLGSKESLVHLARGAAQLSVGLHLTRDVLDRMVVPDPATAPCRYAPSILIGYLTGGQMATGVRSFEWHLQSVIV